MEKIIADLLHQVGPQLQIKIQENVIKVCRSYDSVREVRRRAVTNTDCMHPLFRDWSWGIPPCVYVALQMWSTLGTVSQLHFLKEVKIQESKILLPCAVSQSNQVRTVRLEYVLIFLIISFPVQWLADWQPCRVMQDNYL